MMKHDCQSMRRTVWHLWAMLAVLIAAMAGGPQFARAQNGPVGTGSISGLVQDGAGQPVAGARVTAVGKTFPITMSMEVIQRTQTNAEGFYRFAMLAQGTWEIEVEAPGYRSVHREAQLGTGGQLNIDFVLQAQVYPKGEIAGIVTDRETGQPIARAIVQLSDNSDDVQLAEGPGSGSDSTGSSLPAFWALTDAQGHYSLSGVPAGPHQVKSKADGYLPAVQDVEVHAGLVSLLNFELAARPPALPGILKGIVRDKVTRVALPAVQIHVLGLPVTEDVVTSGDGRFVIDNLKPGEHRLLATKEGYLPADKTFTIVSGQATMVEVEMVAEDPQQLGVIEGRVVDATTSGPLDDARVYYRRINDPQPLDFGNEAEHEDDWPSVETDANGAFRIPNLRAGDYVLRAVAENYYAQWSKTRVPAGGGVSVLFALRPIVPQQSGRIGGLVVDRTTSAPLAGAWVFFAPLPDDGSTTLVQTAELDVPHVRTNDEGKYLTPPLRPGRYIVLARARGYEPARAKAVVTADATTRVDFALTPLQPGSPGAIAGKVVNALTGQPLAGAFIYFAPADGLEPENLQDGSNAPNLTALPHVRTDEQGMYLIKDLAPGAYGLHAWAEGFQPQRQLVKVLPDTVSRANFALRPNPQSEPGSIAGRVIDGPLQQPIAGAYVFFAPVGPIMLPQPAATDASPFSLIQAMNLEDHDHLVKTGADGRYHTPKLRPARYVVLAWAEGYRPESRLVVVLDGRVTEANFALQPLVPVQPGAIAGKVLDAQSSQPVAGAFVFYGLVVDNDATRAGADNESAMPSVRTDEQGRFETPKLRPGVYRLVVRAINYNPAHEKVEVQSGEVARVEIRLQPLVPPLPGAIEGVVTDAETQQPIAGARVAYGPMFDTDRAPGWQDESEDDTDDTAHVVLTDAQGRYRIGELKPGDYYLKVTAAGYEPASRRVKVEPGQTAEASFKLIPADPPIPGAIKGRVENAVTSAPLAGARVYYQRVPLNPVELDPRGSDPSNQSAEEMASIPYVETANDGSYSIEGLRPGQYRLAAEFIGFRPQSRVVAVESGAVTEADFALQPVAQGAGAIAGQVTDAATMQPLAGVRVWVTLTGEWILRGVPPTMIWGETQTDADGRYKLEKIPAGSVIVWATLDGYRQGAQKAIVLPDASIVVDFALQPIPSQNTGGLKGTVREAETEQPIAEAFVFLEPHDPLGFELSKRPDRPRFTLTDANGQYAFEGLPVGEYDVRAVKVGYEAETESVEILTGQVQTLDFLLELKQPPAMGALAGTVVDAATSAPLADVWVRLHLDDSASLTESGHWTVRTDADGFYTFPTVPVGTWKVMAVKSGYQPQVKEAAILANATVVVDFALNPTIDTGILAGTVTDAVSQAPIVEALVVVPQLGLPFGSNGENALHTRTDAQGRYRIDGVPAGQRIVVALHRNYFPDAQLVAVQAGTTATLDFALIPWAPQEGKRLKVRALDAQTRLPIHNAKIHVPVSDWIESYSTWNPFAGQTDLTGQADLGLAPPGDWSLVGSAEGYKPVAVSLKALTLGTVSAGIQLAETGADPVIELMFEPLTSRNEADGWTAYQ